MRYVQLNTSNGYSKKYLKLFLRVFLLYVGLLALILGLAIIAIMVTFTFVVIDSFTKTNELGQFAETYFVPVSEFLWDLFMKLIPGL